MRLEGRTAIVTGGSRGVGRVVAHALAREGADLVLVARSQTDLEAVTAEVCRAGGVASFRVADVGDWAAVEAVVGEAVSRWGGVDILVNAAGIQGPIGPALEADPVAWEQVVRTNLLGTFHCCRAVLPHMVARRAGTIINFSGGGGTSPRPNFLAYAASKAAVVRLTETLAAEVERYGVRVNAVAPGAVNTRMTEEVAAAGPRAGAEAERARRRATEGGVPPERAAALCVFLASEESDGLSGRLISAVHDDWTSFRERAAEIMAGELYTLRRVDGRRTVSYAE